MENPNHHHPVGAAYMGPPTPYPTRDCLKLRKSVPSQREKAIFNRKFALITGYNAKTRPRLRA